MSISQQIAAITIILGSNCLTLPAPRWVRTQRAKTRLIPLAFQPQVLTTSKPALQLSSIQISTQLRFQAPSIQPRVHQHMVSSQYFLQSTKAQPLHLLSQRRTLPQVLPSPTPFRGFQLQTSRVVHYLEQQLLVRTGKQSYQFL